MISVATRTIAFAIEIQLEIFMVLAREPGLEPGCRLIRSGLSHGFSQLPVLGDRGDRLLHWSPPRSSLVCRGLMFLEETLLVKSFFSGPCSAALHR